jgi:hypothetical protein
MSYQDSCEHTEGARTLYEAPVEYGAKRNLHEVISVPTQTVGSKFRRYASEFASASMPLLARALHVRAMFSQRTAV